jgi:hypothetical protein
MLLMRFRSEEGFEEPASIRNLVDVPNLFKSGDCFAHDWGFLRAIHDPFDCNRWRVPSVNHALVIFYRGEDSIFVKDGPVFHDQSIDTVAYVGFKVGQVEVASHLLSMCGFVVSAEEEWIHLIKGRRWVFQFSQDDSTINNA